jgi:hypothetical protein
MATASALPGNLNIAFRRSDEYGTLIDFSISVSGYSFSAEIVSAVTGSTLVTPSVTVVNASTGQVNLALTETQTASLAAGTYLWRMIWVGPGTATRTALEGVCEVYA